MTFSNRDNLTNYVRIYDLDSEVISTIPSVELAPGMVQVRMHVGDSQIEELVWVDSKSLNASPYRHPLFSEEVREYFRTIKEVLNEVAPKSLNEWEDGFRRDEDWEKELRIFLRVAEVYYRLTHNKSLLCKKNTTFIGC